MSRLTDLMADEEAKLSTRGGDIQANNKMNAQAYVAMLKQKEPSYFSDRPMPILGAPARAIGGITKQVAGAAKDIPNDLKETVTGIAGSVKDEFLEGGDRLAKNFKAAKSQGIASLMSDESRQVPIAAIMTPLKAILKAGEEAIVGAGKLVLTDEQEQKIANTIGSYAGEFMSKDTVKSAVESWNELPESTRQTLDDAGTILEYTGIGIGAKASKKGVEAGKEAFKKADVPEVAKNIKTETPIPQTISPDINRDAFKASNQILQVGNKAEEIGRADEFSNSVRQFTRIVGESADEIKNFQQGAEFVKKNLNQISKQRDEIIKPYLKNKVDAQDYLVNLQARIDDLESSAFSKADAQGYKQVYAEAVSDITGESLESIAEKGIDNISLPDLTVEDMVKLNKDLNKRVGELRVLGTLKDLPDDKQVRLQALEELRKGTRRQILENTDIEVGKLNNQISGLVDAETLLRIQRGRANKALDEINWKDWKIASATERAAMVKEYLPMFSDLGKGKLSMLDSKSKMSEEIMDLNVRRIRGNYTPFIDEIKLNARPQKPKNTGTPEEGTPSKGLEQQPQSADVPDKKTILENQSSLDSVTEPKLTAKQERLYRDEAINYFAELDIESKAALKSDLERGIEFGRYKDVDDFITKKEAEYEKMGIGKFSEIDETLDILNPDLEETVNSISGNGALDFVNKYSGGEFKGRTLKEALDFIEKKDVAFFEKNGLGLDALDGVQTVGADEAFDMIKTRIFKSNGRKLTDSKTGKKQALSPEASKIEKASPKTITETKGLAKPKTSGTIDGMKRVVSDDVYDRAKKNLSKSKNRLNSGVPIDELKDYVIVAAYHIENGVRDATDLIKKIPELTREQADKLFKYINSDEYKPKNRRILNVLDDEDAEYLGRIFSEEQVQNFRDGNFEHWREGGKEYFERIAGANLVSISPKSAKDVVSGAVKDFTMPSTTIYHGTPASNIDSIIKNGFKRGDELGEISRGGGYGAIQESISFSIDPNVSAIFTGSEASGGLFKLKISPNAKVVTFDGADMAEDLNKYVKELRSYGADAVYLPGEKEVVVINKEVLNLSDMEYEKFDVIKGRKEIWNKANKK